MGIEQLASVFESATCIAALIVVLLCLVPNIRLESFRQDMFNLRAELFDYAADGHISFNDSAYKHLRQIMNGFIRYGHQLTFFRVCVTLMQLKVAGEDSNFDRTEKWERALQNVKNEQVKEALTDFHNRAFTIVLGRLALGSPFIICLLLFGMATAILHKSWHGLRQRYIESVSASVSKIVDTRLLQEEAIKAAVA